MPKPSRSIPIWLGGSCEAAFDRAARLGGRLHLLRRATEQTVDAGNDCANACWTMAGRSRISAPTAWSARQRWRDAIPAAIDAWREAGGTHVSVVTMGLGLDSAERHIDYLADLAGRLDIGSSAAR